MDLKEVGIALYLESQQVSRREQVWMSEYASSSEKQLPSGSCQWPTCSELGSLCICTIPEPSPGAGREVGGKKDGHLSASHPRVVSAEWDDQLVVVPHNGTLFPLSGKL